MDLLTHSVCGAVVGLAGLAPRASTRASVTLGVLAANAPDLDIVIWAVAGFDEYLLSRQGITHGILAAGTGVLLLAAVATRLTEERFARLLLVAALSWCSHLLLDVAGVWGVGLLEPFSAARFALRWLYDTELILLGLLSIPLWAGSLVKVHRRTLARGSLGLLICYPLVCGGLGALAAPPESLSFPSPFVPSFWTVIKPVEGGYRLGFSSAFGPSEPGWGALVSHNREHPVTRVVRADPVGGRYWRWAVAPTADVRCRGRDFTLLFRDLRFTSMAGSEPAPALVFEVSRTGEVTDRYWASWLTGRQIPTVEAGCEPGLGAL